jgi:hypothetical protein
MRPPLEGLGVVFVVQRSVSLHLKRLSTVEGGPSNDMKGVEGVMGIKHTIERKEKEG